MKIADQGPPYCSSCFNQVPDKRYVDFQAAWDGPVLDTEAQIKVAIDDLIICEDCVGAAARLVGYVNKKEMIKENFELGRAVERRNEELEQAKNIIRDYENTIKTLRSGRHIEKASGRPKLRIPDEAVA